MGENTNETVDAAEAELRRIEGEREKVAQSICSIRGSAATHGRICLALAEIRRGLHETYMMRGDAE